MIIIADCGSTKSDWVLLDDSFNELLSIRTIGFNPYFINSIEIYTELSKVDKLVEYSKSVKKVFFYGTGASTDRKKSVVKEALSMIFENADILIDHDLVGACYAAYSGEPSIVCILGTGSNSCFFDGTNIFEETHSLAYILGDEGSGNDLGKRVVKSYFTKKMPKHLSLAFDHYYKLNIEQLNDNVYNNKFANSYLASFNKFVLEHKDDPYIQKIIFDSMEDFFYYQILPYKQCRLYNINFIGSIAHIYEDIIRSIASCYHLSIGNIIRKPIDNLVDYHKKYILKNDTLI